MHHRLQLLIPHATQKLRLQQLQGRLHGVQRSPSALLTLRQQVIDIQQELRLRLALTLDLII